MDATATIRVGSLWSDWSLWHEYLTRAAEELGVEVEIRIELDSDLDEDESSVDCDDDDLLQVAERISCEEIIEAAEELDNDDLLAIADRRR